MINGIIKADARLAQKPKINVAMFGRSGVGKTTQARTLDPEKTLFIDLEGGTLAIADWPGDVLDLRKLAADLGAHPWEMCRAIALFIGGPDPADASGHYSKPVYDQLEHLFGNPKGLEKYDSVYVDSITVASRWALSWCKLQPEAFSEKTGKPDTRGAYGLLGTELMRWLTHLQHCPKSIIVVGILDRFEDDMKRVTYSPQIEGSKASRELSGIFDQVLTLDYLYDDRGKPLLNERNEQIRAFYTQTGNAYGFPAKDRSGRLDDIEPPDLGAMLHKMRTGPRRDNQLITTLETPKADQTSPDASAPKQSQPDGADKPAA